MGTTRTSRAAVVAVAAWRMRGVRVAGPEGVHGHLSHLTEAGDDTPNDEQDERQPHSDPAKWGAVLRGKPNGGPLAEPPSSEKAVGVAHDLSTLPLQVAKAVDHYGRSS